MKTIINAIASSKFITEEKSEALIKKITTLAGSNKARNLKRNVVVDGRGKIENKQIFYIIDTINEAINQHKKLCYMIITKLKQEVPFSYFLLTILQIDYENLCFVGTHLQYLIMFFHLKFELITAYQQAYYQHQTHKEC